ncbi:unnamed protein product, partial [Mesorhabditis spiculigera]
MRPIGWLLFFLETVSAGQLCQDGGLEFFESFNTSSCIYFEYEALNYNDAKNSCLSRGLDLIQFRDVSTSMFVNSFIPDNNQDEPWYIGVERNRNGIWVYADNTTLQYTNWAADARDEVIRGFQRVLWEKFQTEIKADEKFVAEHRAAFNFTCDVFASMWLRFYDGDEAPSPAKHSRPHYARIDQDPDCAKDSHFVDQNITVTFPRYICERAMPIY